MSEAAALALEGVERRFRQGGETLAVLRGVTLSVKAGEIVALVGPSGAGKSTLLHVAGLLERPDAGEVRVCGALAGTLGESARTRLRRERLGFVYQYHHLLPEFSALENVALPQMIAGRPRASAEARGRELLSSIGLAARLHHRPGRLSLEHDQLHQSVQKEHVEVGAHHSGDAHRCAHLKLPAGLYDFRDF